MTIDEIKGAKNARPFHPFLIRMADGREIRVTHPDRIAWEDSGRVRTVTVLGGGWHQVLDLALITALATEPVESI